MKKVLVIDDEASILTLLRFNLEKEGYQVTTCDDGQSGFQTALEQSFDFIILDLMLPFLDGIEITKKLREEKIHTPILMLTAKDDSVDKIIGLEIGADDYMTKPFSPREIIARMKAIFRRTTLRQAAAEEATDEEVLTIHEISLSPTTFTVTVRGQAIDLTPKEFELLHYFMKRKNRILDRDTLLHSIWNYDFAGQTRIVDVHVSHLREKIEIDPKNPLYLITVRGFGYKFQDVKS